MRDHTKLRAFDLADEVVLLIYRATVGFPKEEINGLTSQMNCRDGEGFGSPASINAQNLMAFGLNNLNSYFGLRIAVFSDPCYRLHKYFDQKDQGNLPTAYSFLSKPPFT